LVASAGLLALRAPQLIAAPRLFAEESRVFFRHAFESGLFDSLTYVYWKAGYLNLVTNVATTLGAHVVALEYAPYATMGIALAIQLLPFLILLFGRSTAFRGEIEKGAACCILLFAPTIAPEVWLTSLHSTVFLDLAALLILLEDLKGVGRARRWSYRLVLLLGGYRASTPSCCCRSSRCALSPIGCANGSSSS